MLAGSQENGKRGGLCEVEIRMCQLLCFLMSYQIVIVFSFSCIDREKGWGLFVTAAGIVCLFVWLVG